MAIETLHVRASLVPGLSAGDLEEPLVLQLLTERYGLDIVGGLQTIEPTVTNEEESAVLGVPLHSPALLFERTTRSRAGEIVEYVRSIYRGDRYRLVTELSRDAAPALTGQYHRAVRDRPGAANQNGLQQSRNQAIAGKWS